MRPSLTLPLFILVWISSYSLYAQSGPGGVGNGTGTSGQPANKLWLRADAGAFSDAGVTAAVNNATVYQWNDFSDNSFHALQTTAGSRPTFKTAILNGKPVLRLNGTTHQMLMNAGLNNASVLPMAFFAVTNNTTNPKGLFDSRPLAPNCFRFFNDGSGPGANNSVEFHNNNPAKGSLNLSTSGSVISILAGLDGSSNRQLDAYITGTQIGSVETGNTDPVVFNSARLGSINTGSDGFFNGDVAEVIYFNSEINEAQRIIVENYLGAKYGLSLSSNEYYTNASHIENLIGIGTTDGTQKHTQANGGGIWLSEDEATLDGTNEFLFAGHNGTVHNAANASNLLNLSVIASGITTRWAREYRLEKTGNLDANITFDYTQAGLSRASNTGEDFFLLYRSATGATNFTIVPLKSTADASIPGRVTFSVANGNLLNGYYTLGLKSQPGPGTLYTYTANCSGGCNWNSTNSWTTDPTGLLLLNSRVPRTIDNVTILNGNSVSADYGIQVVTGTLQSGGTLTLAPNSANTFTTLSGSGLLKLSATSGTAIFPTVTTNNFISTAGSTVEYFQNSSYALPAAPATYRNLIISGGGIKSISSVLTVNENFTIQPPTTFNTNSNFNISGHFSNNGQFNQTGGTTTFSGASAKNINGSPIATIFNNFTISAGTGTLTSTIDFTVTGNFTNTSNTVPAFNATSGTVILSSASAQSIGGAGTGATNFYNFYTSGAGVKTISRNFWVNGSLVVLTGSTLQFPAGGTGYTLNTNNLTIQAALNMAAPGSATTHSLIIRGSQNLVTGSVLNLVNGGNVANTTYAGTSQSVSGGTPSVVNYNSVTINAGTTVNLLAYNLPIQNSLSINGTLNIGSYTVNRVALGGTISIGAAGRLLIGGTNTFPSNYSTNTLSAGSSVEYIGTNQTVRSFTYSNLRTAGSGNKTLGGSTTVNGTLTMEGGVIVQGANNLIFGVSGTISATSPSTTNMIQNGGTGIIRKYLNVVGSLSIPTGTGSVFTPIQVNITSATLGGAAGSRYYDVRNLAALAPSQLDNSYSLVKYWEFGSANLSNISVTYTATYNSSEANPSAEPIYVPGYWNGTWTTGLISDISSQTITFSRTGLASLATNRLTAGPSVAFVPGTFYSINDGNYEDAANWSLSGYGGAIYGISPTNGSNVSIGNDKNILATSGSKTIPTLTIDGSPNPGTLDIQGFTGFTINTLNGAGKIRISSTGPTAVYPTITTNNFNVTSGSTTEFYGSADFAMPGSVVSFQNLIISGTGVISLGNTTTVNENLVVDGNLELNNRTTTVTGTTVVNGSLTDNSNTGTNTFAGNVTVSAGGNLSTANGSAFLFAGGITNNGTFSKTGNGSVTFQTNNQIINGDSQITLAGTITLSSGITVTNLNNSLIINGLTLNPNSKLLQNYGSFPATYTGFSDAVTIQGKFNSLSASNNAGTAVSSSNGNNITLTRAGAGNVYGLKSTIFSSAASAVIMQFDLNASSAGTTSSAATLLLGTGFTDNATIHTATARLRFNLGAGGSDWSITHPDGPSATSSTFNNTQTVTWVINRSGATVTYLSPNNSGTSNTLTTGNADVWVGNTRFASGLAIQTAAQTINQLKVVMDGGSGSFNLNNIRINPIGTINTSAISATCFKVTPYDPDSVLVVFTTPGSMNSNTHFNSNNTFTAQLSNAAGSFAAPVNIGTKQSSLLSDTIRAAIPANTASGAGYRIRVVSNSPLVHSNDNGSNFNVSQYRIAPAPTQSIIPSGTGTMLTATGVSVTSYQWAYYTILGGTITDIPGQTASTYTPFGPHFPGAGTYSIVCRMTSSGGCGTNYSNYVVLYINCPPTANLVVNGDFSSGNSGFTSDYNYVADDPMVQNEMWPEGTYAVNNNPRNMHTNFCNMTTDAMRSPLSGGNMLIGNAATSGSVALWKQNITVTPNTDYVLSFYASSLAGTTSSLLFGIYTGCYRTGADVSVPFETFNCQWNKYSFQFNSGASSSIPLEIRNISAAASGNDIAIDDIVLYACASVSSPPFIVANAPYWRGVTSDWFNKDNWGTSCALPGCADDVYIPLLPSGKVYPIINAAGAAARTLEIRTGAKLTINSGRNISLCGNLDNYGTLTAATNSTITFIGNQNPALIHGNITGSNKPGNLVINKTNVTDTVRLTGNLDITGNFTITKGIFKTGGFSMTLPGNFSNSGTYLHQNANLELTGGNSSISQTGTGSFYNLKINKNAATNTVTFNPSSTVVANELDLTRGQAVTTGTNEISVTNAATNSVINFSNQGYVRGRLRRALSGSGSYDFPVGDATRYERVNVDITSPLVGTSTLLGYFNSATAPGTTPYLTEAGKLYEYLCTNGYWTLTPNAQPSSGMYNFTMFPVGLNCAAVYQTVAKRTNSAAAWTFGGSSPVSATQRNGFTSFSEFAQVDAEEPLPVNLLSFTGQWKGQKVVLQWRTAKERDNSHFDIERSIDGISFEKIGEVANKMHISDANRYDFTDLNPGSGLRYYRLKQVDNNGGFDYSGVVKVQNQTFEQNMAISPNPWTIGSQLKIEFNDNSENQYRMKLVNSNGKTTTTQILDSKAGWNEIEIPGRETLPAGIYFMSIHSLGIDEQHFPPVKIVVQ